MSAPLKRALALAALLAFPTLPQASQAAPGYAWELAEGEHATLTRDGKAIARYVLIPLDPEKREDTYKPFHHIYDEAGEDFITKGVGGQFTHHRGIFYGFAKVTVHDEDGTKETLDNWHARGGYQQHHSFSAEHADSDGASHTAEIGWYSDKSGLFATESRTLAFSHTDAGLQVDFTSTLTTDRPKVVVDGDPQHAGFHFRASNEVNDSTKGQTYYIRPGTGKDAPGKTINWSGDNDTEATRDQAWKAMSFVVGGDRYTVVYLDHPENPKPARYSERDYGRFGSYFVSEATPEKPLTVKYRLIITKGEIGPEAIEELSEGFVKGS
jgi:antitoxin (DNA-binding transcriptional repressor) of toxin-antitoxin stability system